MAASIIDSSNKKFNFREIEIIRKYNNEIPLIPCEPGKIQQVFINILRNGAEAMKDTSGEGNGSKPRIILRITPEHDAGMIRIEIKDNGPGIDQNICKHIFEPFFTTKPAGKGTGLGLSVSYFIITENHNGDMSVESAPGEGTKFIIRLPLERKEHVL
ncbi:MAG: hypothetical protein JRJ39_10030 [Deltaproteobacteria bacterium]|nr:hypothetical protein [Deltaproteobacteria bacterium]